MNDNKMVSKLEFVVIYKKRRLEMLFGEDKNMKRGIHDFLAWEHRSLITDSRIYNDMVTKC